MTDKTEAQPEALRLELHQECADFATSLRSAANVVQLQGREAPPSFLKAADLFEQAAAEIQQLKAREHELVQLHDHSNLVVDAAKERIASLATELRETNEMNQQLRDQNTAVDAACAALEKTGIEAANRAASAEQQVTALTQRLDMANRLNTDARNRLAQLSARQAAPDGWRLVPVEPTQAMTAAGCPVGEAVDYFDMGTAYRAMLSAAPPPPEREPLSADDLREPKNGKAWRLEWWNESLRMMLPSQMRLDRVQAFKTGTLVLTLKKSANAHGIGATND